MRTVSYALAGVSALVCAALLGTGSRVRASDAEAVNAEVLPIVAIAEAGSLLGEDIVIMTGWMEIVREPPVTENAYELSNLSITNLELIGASRFGLVSVTERPDSDSRYASGGELRANGTNAPFPASSSIALFLDLEIPSTPFGALALHNESALHLEPMQDGQVVPLDSWPPLGIVFRTAPQSCLQLVDEESVESEEGICVSSLRIEFAPSSPSFSVGRGAAHLLPADILGLTPSVGETGVGQAPFVRISCSDLGLIGCNGTFPEDNIDALSFGLASEPSAVDFSVSTGALGVEGSAIREQSICPPGEPGAAPEPESDVFHADLNGSNRQIFDGNGPVGACVSTFPLGLLESIAARDELNAFETHDASILSPGAGKRVYFSLDAASPALEALNASGGDVLVSQAGGQPSVYASHADLGLQTDDELDALCLGEDGDGSYSPADDLLFSLHAGSPTLAAIGARPGDLIAPGTVPTVAVPAAALGLQPTDDLDAAQCGQLAGSLGSGDANCDDVTNSIDASLILQFVAGLIAQVPCPDRADINGAGLSSVDAALVLQKEAGLLAGRMYNR